MVSMAAAVIEVLAVEVAAVVVTIAAKDAVARDVAAVECVEAVPAAVVKYAASARINR